jgi:hypothetical protein
LNWFVRLGGLLFSLRHPPPRPTRAIKSTKTPPISLESVLRARLLYEISYTRLGALFLAVLSCFSPDFVLLRPHLRRNRHPTIFRLLGTPPSFGCGDIYGGNLGVTSLRDTVSSRSCTSAHTTLRPSGTIGLWARPTPPHHLGSSIGQAFQSHLFGRPHSLHDACGPRANHHRLRRRSLSRCLSTLFGRRQPRIRARPGMLSGCVLLLRYRHQVTSYTSVRS